MERSTNRYDGQPFLRLLDSYVLDAIGQLTDQQRSGLSMVEPKLRAVYGASGSWQEIVRNQLELPESFPQSIRSMWERYLSAARSQGLSVHPNEFTERFVAENFPELQSR